MKAKRFLYSTADCRCGGKTLLVRSREGGFVSRNCLKCGKSNYAGETQLPDLQCDHCGNKLMIRMVDGKNYFYVCDTCNQKWQLSEVLPHWNELFEYSGLGVESDLL